MAFPSLEKLVVNNLSNLEGMLRDEGAEMLPRLSHLNISAIPTLKLSHLPSVEYLEADEIKDAASFMEGVVENIPCLKTLFIGSIYELKVLPDQLSKLSALQKLYIYSCDELEDFPEHVLQGLTSLRSLTIVNCKKLKRLSDDVGHLASLECFEVRKCPELVLPNNMNQLTALQEVIIDDRLPEVLKCIPSLQRLEINDLACSSLPDWLGELTSLRELEIWNCSELRSIPSSIQRLTNLTKLTIEDCPKLKKRCKRETGEDWQYIAHIPQLQVDRYTEKTKTSTFCDKFGSFWTIYNKIGMRSATNFFRDPPGPNEFDIIIDYKRFDMSD
ncbi:hypothetical protein Fmac_002828 [Flemingia macrophylla]|uniref:Disease resistance R13L4/SHOC-2-like LRR domain-containing protein n=1 Tax=Flemingia macrophylla TaxID=520843 RepID=A0ABD1NMS2_9FABA